MKGDASVTLAMVCKFLFQDFVQDVGLTGSGTRIAPPCLWTQLAKEPYGRRGQKLAGNLPRKRSDWGLL